MLQDVFLFRDGMGIKKFSLMAMHNITKLFYVIFKNIFSTVWEQNKKKNRFDIKDILRQLMTVDVVYEKLGQFMTT